MEKDNKKRYIPGSDLDWGLELPDGYSNSLVTKDGRSWDNGYNFDERDDDSDEQEEVSYGNLANETNFDPEAAKRAKEEAENN